VRGRSLAGKARVGKTNSSGVVRDPARINNDAWSSPGTLRSFARSEGWSDAGERAAFEYLAKMDRFKAVLDIGVGAGRTVPMMLDLSDDYQAIDFNESMVEACRAKHPSVRVEFGDARDLSRFDDNSFDLVAFSWNGIDAVDHDDRELIFREVRRVLKDAGTFFFSTHNKAGPGHGETPWRLRVSHLSHPRHLGQLVAFFPVNVRNHRRLRPMNRDMGGWSMMNCAAHHFELFIHYTTLENQLAELQAAGFAPDPIVFSDRRGARIRPGDDTRRTWWFQILARA
jgi:SAM-dependent methyltransferase